MRAMTATAQNLMTTETPAGTFVLRTAEARDVPAILGLLAEDSLAAGREDTAELEPYLAAFAAIDADPAHLLVVGELCQPEGSPQVVATFQLSMLPGLSRRGSWRAQIEAVRVAGTMRGNGLGRLMIEWALAESRRRGAAMVQLTTDKSRTAAHRFYARLGFAASHEGMKLTL